MLPKHPFPLMMVRNLFTLSLVKFGYSDLATVSDPRCCNTSIYTQGCIWTVLTDRDRALLDSTVQIAQHQHHLMTMIDSLVAIVASVHTGWLLTQCQALFSLLSMIPLLSGTL